MNTNIKTIGDLFVAIVIICLYYFVATHIVGWAFANLFDVALTTKQCLGVIFGVRLLAPSCNCKKQ